MADKTGFLLCELHSKNSSKSPLLSYLLPHKFWSYFCSVRLPQEYGSICHLFSFSIL